MLILNITGEVPSKKNSVKFNSYSRTTYKTERFDRWHKIARDEVLLQLRSAEYVTPPVDYQCQIGICFIHGDLRRRDSDNGVNSIFDLLTDCGVIPDDNWKIVRQHRVYNAYVKGNPRCIVGIYDKDEEASFENDFSSFVHKYILALMEK